MADRNGAYHDPDGPVVVALGIPLGEVRQALSTGRWVERPGDHDGMALFLTRDGKAADAMAARGVPAAAIVDSAVGSDDDDAPRVAERAMGEWLRAFDDGATITAREADAFEWVSATRAEEERTHAEGARVASEQLERVQAHLDAIEASSAYRLSRRMVAVRERVRRLARRP